MLKNERKLAVVFAIALTAISLSGCSVGAEEVNLGSFFGAPVTLVFSTSHGKSDGEKLCSSIRDRLSEIERCLSTEEIGSDIYKFNAAHGSRNIKITKTAFEVLTIAKKYYIETGGAFDPTVYRLTDLWGFTARHKTKDYKPLYAYDRQREGDYSFALPDEKFVQAFLSLVDFAAVEFKSQAVGDETVYYLSYDGEDVTVDGVAYNMQIDLSAIAKGYAADEAQKLINQSGISGIYISFGGSSLYLADNEGRSWGLGVVNPIDNSFRRSFARIEVKNKFVATSGTYENSYIYGGATYHHIIDSATGRPSESNILSVTLISGEEGGGAATDSLATALLVAGRDAAINYLKRVGAYNYILVTKDAYVYTDVKDITLLSDDFTLAENILP